MATTTQTVYRNQPCQLEKNSFLKAGHHFLGWSENRTASVATYEDEATISGGFSENKNLYAIWEINRYTVHFDPNSGSGTMSDQTFTYGQEQTLTPNGFSREGHVFVGWARSADGDQEFGD